MDLVSKEEVRERLKDFLKQMSETVFIHPTDTIYGLGCDATNTEIVKKLREIKGNLNHPFSVIAPSKQWIYDNCDVKGMEDKIELLPGPVTIILPLKNKECISGETNNYFETIGVRIPNHWISEIVSIFGKPIITTSANKTGEEFITTLNDLSSNIKPYVSFAIDEGNIKGIPSKVISAEKVLRD